MTIDSEFDESFFSIEHRSEVWAAMQTRLNPCLEDISRELRRTGHKGKAAYEQLLESPLRSFKRTASKYRHMTDRAILDEYADSPSLLKDELRLKCPLFCAMLRQKKEYSIAKGRFSKRYTDMEPRDLLRVLGLIAEFGSSAAPKLDGKSIESSIDADYILEVLDPITRNSQYGIQSIIGGELQSALLHYRWPGSFPHRPRKAHQCLHAWGHAKEFLWIDGERVRSKYPYSLFTWYAHSISNYACSWFNSINILIPKSDRYHLLSTLINVESQRNPYYFQKSQKAWEPPRPDSAY